MELAARSWRFEQARKVVVAVSLAFPPMVWVALAGGLLLLAAAAIPKLKGMAPRDRLQWHRRAAGAGLLLVLVHAYMGLSRFW